jgi:hypothetical protein
MSGRDKSAENAQKQMAQQQQAIATEQNAQAKINAQEMKTLQQPAIDFSLGLVSNDPTKRIQAASPMLSQIAKGQQASQQGILESVPEGPARDYMLASMRRDAPSQQYQTLNDLFFKGMDTLTGIGTERGNYGLQQQGASARFYEGAQSAQNNLSQQAAQRKAATMGAIRAAAGVAGDIATGGMSGIAGKAASAPMASAPLAKPR